MKKLIFTGCSFTAGNGWTDTDRLSSSHIEVKDSPYLWVNLCHNQIEQYKNLELINAGNGGASCAEIFKNTTGLIAKHGSDIDTIFCQWTSMPRYRFDIGFELWSTNIQMAKFQMREGHAPAKRYQGNDIFTRFQWDKEYVNDIMDRMLAMHHLHSEIVKLVDYCNILKNLAAKFDIKLYFINGLCPWDQNYFIRLENVLPDKFTPFTKKDILDIDSRNDEDIFKLYKIMHDDYDRAGGIDPTDWIDLYSSMMANRIDTNFDLIHPGAKANQLYFEQIKAFLDTQ